MARSVSEWVGRDDDTAIPDRVKVRVFDRCKGLCHRCGRAIRAGERWVLEHLIALVNWLKTPEKPHGNRESNLGLTCCNCIAPKNAEDVAEKAEVYAIRARHLLPHKAKTRPMPGGRSSPYKIKMNGEVVRR